MATPLDQAGFAVLVRLDILRFDLLGNLQRRLRQVCLFLRQGLDPGFHRVQHVQDEAQSFFSAGYLVPIPVKSCLQARCAHHFGSRLFGYLDQLPPLLVSHHAHDLFQRVSQEIVGILDSSGSPQRAAIECGS